MQSIKISDKEAGQRLDKFLQKYLSQAGKSFIYKMLRKKNITLNGKKAEGFEKLNINDEIKIFFSEETFVKFTKEENADITDSHPSESLEPLEVLYEDNHILIVNKPAGLLSQKARPEDISLVEQITAYLLDTGAVTKEQLKTFRPGICNRLDRNTSGIIAAGKTMEGLQVMGELFKNRTIHKYYYCIVKGNVKKEQMIEGYLYKNHNHNRVTIHKEAVEGADYIKTQYFPVYRKEEFTLLKVKLITGKSHQIRAHLHSEGHPIIGDGKYGDVSVNKYFKKNFKLKHQLLHAGELIFPDMDENWSSLSKKCIKAPWPDYFETIVNEFFPNNVKV